MEYNTKRQKLQITDYGRNIYKLIDYAKTIEDRDKRNAVAASIVNVMAQVNPKVKEETDYKHKLWDHLLIMSDFQLDVDSPYPISHDINIDFTPKPLKYKNNSINYRHYGKVLEDLIEKVSTYPEGEEKETLIELIAHQMKRSYLVWNRNTVSDELILEQFDRLSEGRLKLREDFQLLSNKEYENTIASDNGKKQNPNRVKKKQSQKHQANSVKVKSNKKNKNFQNNKNSNSK
jgi:hypothetical protein